MKDATIVKIVFCGPGDVGKELEITAKVIQDWNLKNFEAMNCGLKLTNWKSDAVPSMKGRGQAMINEQLIDEADIMIAVFWRRFGTPTGMHGSGTAEEVQRAMAREIPVMLYFSDIEAPMIKVDNEQAEQLSDFRARAITAGLPWSFRNRTEFEKLIGQHLDFKVREIAYQKNKDGLSESGQSIFQSAIGDGNVQLAGNSNTINIKSSGQKPPKIVVNYGDEFLSPSQQKEVQDLVHELVVLIEQVDGRSTKQAMGEVWSRLRNKFDVAKYELLAPDQLPEVNEWFQVSKRILLGKARRKAPAVHRRGRIPAIKAAMNSMGRSNDDYYPEIAARLKMKPFISLKALSGKNLERVYSLVFRDKKKIG